MAQKGTKKEKNAEEFKLQGYHFRAIALRFYGKTYDEIIKKLGEEYSKDFNPSTVRRWFASGGVLEKPYADFYKKETHRMTQATRHSFATLVAKVPKALEHILTKRKVINMFGEVVKDKDGNDEIKYDGVTVKACQLIVQTAGIDVGDMSDEDLIDEMMDRIEQISDKQIADEQDKVKKDTK